MSVTYKVGDTRPYLDATLSDANGAVDLSTSAVESVRFVMEDKDGTEVVNESSTGANVTITGSTSGQVRYAWQTGDLANPGNYYGEWKVLYTDGSAARFPNTGHAEIAVGPALST